MRSKTGIGRAYLGETPAFHKARTKRYPINRVIIEAWERDGIVFPTELREQIIKGRSAESIRDKYRRYLQMCRNQSKPYVGVTQGEQDND
jgi:S-adenosylmethionine:diacylglycerol 3-amino-3-carboxypropyl transferase